MFGIEPMEKRMADYLTLKSEEFINNTIVDFGLKVLNNITIQKENWLLSTLHFGLLSQSQKQILKVVLSRTKTYLFPKNNIEEYTDTPKRLLKRPSSSPFANQIIGTCC